MTEESSKMEEVEKRCIRAKWESFKSGFSSSTILALLYAIMVFIPTMIYLELMTGAAWGVSAAWFTLLFWIEIGKATGRRVTKQEAFMILTLTGAEMFYPLSLIYNAWYRTSPQAKLFDIAPYIPDWVAPPPEAGILDLRTFFHPSWILPIAVAITSFLFGQVFSFGLGLLGREIYVEVERLYFPIEHVNAQIVTTLTGSEERPIRLLSVFAVIGFIYGFILYTAPFLIQAYTGRYIQFIPLPWVDFNVQIERVFPGASFGIFTDIGPLTTGFILSFPTVIGIFIGSMAVWFFGNWLSVVYNLSPKSWWAPGMLISMAWNRSLLYFWFAPLIGIGLAVGLGPIIRHPRTLAMAFLPKAKKIKERLTDPISSKIILTFLIVGLGSITILYYILVPDFILYAPWFLPLMFIIPFLTLTITGRMYGETGISSFPSDYLQNLIYYLSGYSGVDIWFAPTTTPWPGIEKLKWFKTAQLTETKADSILKTYWFILPFAIIIGFFYVQIFWSIAPIPSGRYPGVRIFWDINATMHSLWIRGQLAGLFNPYSVLISFFIGLGLYFGLNFIHSPITLTALFAGASQITPISVTMLIGAVLAKIFCRVFHVSEEWWNKNKLLIAAGLILGESISVTIGLSISIIINSLWTLPV